MKIVHGNEDIGRIFTNSCQRAERGIFKLGVLQDYVGEDASPSWQAWDAGDYEQSIPLALSDPRYMDWIAFCKENARFTRVQVVDGSENPYAAWQLALFAEYQKQNAEKVFLVESACLLGKVALPESDIVIFDDQRVLQWSYIPESGGKVNGGKVWDVLEGDDISGFLTLRQEVLDHARPLGLDLP